MLAYAGSVLPLEVWAPAAIRIVEAIELRLDNTRDPAMQTIHVHNLVAIGEMVIAAEHSELSPIAAIHLGELLVRELTATSQYEAWFDELKPGVVKILKSASAAEDPGTASEAASTLARLKASSRSRRDKPPPPLPSW
jgi:hypothetical protein